MIAHQLMIFNVTDTYFPHFLFSPNQPLCTVTKEHIVSCNNAAFLAAHVDVIAPWGL